MQARTSPRFWQLEKPNDARLLLSPSASSCDQEATIEQLTLRREIVERLPRLDFWSSNASGLGEWFSKSYEDLDCDVTESTSTNPPSRAGSNLRDSLPWTAAASQKDDNEFSAFVDAMQQSRVYLSPIKGTNRAAPGRSSTPVRRRQSNGRGMTETAFLKARESPVGILDHCPG